MNQLSFQDSTLLVEFFRSIFPETGQKALAQVWDNRKDLSANHSEFQLYFQFPELAEDIVWKELSPFLMQWNFDKDNYWLRLYPFGVLLMDWASDWEKKLANVLAGFLSEAERGVRNKPVLLSEILELANVASEDEFKISEMLFEFGMIGNSRKEISPGKFSVNLPVDLHVLKMDKNIKGYIHKKAVVPFVSQIRSRDFGQYDFLFQKQMFGQMLDFLIRDWGWSNTGLIETLKPILGRNFRIATVSDWRNGHHLPRTSQQKLALIKIFPLLSLFFPNI